MTTSPQWAPTMEPDGVTDMEFDLLVDESTSPSPETPSGPEVTQFIRIETDRSAVTDTDTDRSAVAEPDDALEEPTGSHAISSAEYSATAGTPGRGVIVSAALGTAAAAVLDLALVGRLSFFFDLCFVVVCLVAAMAVRSRDLFTAAVLPPLAYAGVIGGVALFWPDAIVADGTFSQTFFAGLAAHAGGLVGGYGAALVTVGARVYARRQG